MSYDVSYVGTSGEPVVVLNDFHPHPEHLRDMAGRSRFGRLGPHYPGVQAGADPRHLEPVEGVVTEVLREVFGAGGAPKVVQCSFSVVSVPDGELAPIQRLPHVDTLDPGRVALLHYLSGTGGGTAFYRHRATGFEVLDEQSFPVFREALEREGMPKAGYMRGSDSRFEMIGEVEAVPNRAVMYRSRILHSGKIEAGFGFSDAPAEGRLTLNTFFQL